MSPNKPIKSCEKPNEEKSKDPDTSDLLQGTNKNVVLASTAGMNSNSYIRNNFAQVQEVSYAPGIEGTHIHTMHIRVDNV